MRTLTQNRLAEVKRWLLDLRIQQWYWKAVYIVGVLTTRLLLYTVLVAIGTPLLLANLLVTGYEFGAVLLGARTFRGRDEPMLPPRPWWQMTARPKLSKRLGVACIVFIVGANVFLLLETLGVITTRSGRFDVSVGSWVINLIFYAALAYLYLNSAARLKALGPPEPQPTYVSKLRLK